MIDFKDIAKIFEEIELSLIKSLKRNLSRHKQEEKEQGFEWASWQAEKLRNLDKFRKENSSIMNEYTDIIDSDTRQLMEEQFREGVNGITVKHPETISETPRTVLASEPKFFGVDDRKITKLIDDVVNLEKHAEVAALRTMDDVYRQTVHKAQLAMSTGMPLQKAIDMSVKDFLDKGIKCIVYRDGRRVNIADYVRMALRTTSTRAKLQGESAKYSAMGYDTVIVTQYSMCSKTCLPWQGRPYINDVFVLWDGEIEDRGNGGLWGKSHYCGKWFPLLSMAINAGLFHPNCRHTIGLYKEGITNIPEPVNNTEAEKRYKLEQKQRRLENEVRKARRRAEGFSDPENIRRAKKEINEAQKRLADFINQTNAAYGKTVLKRNYDREKIYPKSVDISQESGIIEETREKTAETAVRDVHSVGKIDIEKYKCVTEDIQTNEVIITEKQIEHIKERHPNDYERFGKYFKIIVEDPDYIIEANKPNTAVILKEIVDNNERFKTILRLITSFDDSKYKNSIITFMKIDEKDWKRIIKNKKVLYKSE